MKDKFGLNELPDTIYVRLEDSDHMEIWNKLLEHNTIRKVSEKYKIPVRNLYKYKEGNSGYPIKVLRKLLKATSIKIDKATIKTQRNSNSMQIRLPIKITEEFSEFLGYLLGDGGIDHQWGVHMTSNDIEILNRFNHLINKIFGRIENHIYDYKNRKTCYYPKILGIILTDTFRIPKGSKVDSNSCVPEFILKLMNLQMKKKFITSFYECDGASKYIRIVQGGKNLEIPPKILTQIKDMLIDIGFVYVTIKSSTIYITSKGKRRRWVLNVINSREREKFKILFSCKKLSQLNIGS